MHEALENFIIAMAARHDQLLSKKRINYEELAKAGLATLLEPTPDMLAAAWRVWYRGSRPPEKVTPGPAFKESLQAMIKVLLQSE